MMDYSKAPMSSQYRIGIIGRGNVGKSTLMNIITGQDTSMVSPILGTTTDPVKKSIEIHEIGPCLFFDTPGYDDRTPLGNLRIEKTMDLIPTLDLILFVVEDLDEVDIPFLELVKDKKVIFLGSNQKKWTLDNQKAIYDQFHIKLEILPKKNIREFVIQKMLQAKGSETKEKKIFHNILQAGDFVMLVMPQDREAPKGRLILPQVQSMRELLDDDVIFLGVTLENMEDALKLLSKKPDLIVTDSQYFEEVYKLKPKESKLTSFSVLFSAFKGDIDYFRQSAYLLGRLTEDSHILIAEACTHAPIEEDIGRVKIPNLLKKRYGDKIRISHVAGNDFPKDLSNYDLIIQCGGCMIHQNQMSVRVQRAKEAGIGMTNYGMAIAFFKGIIDKIDYPQGEKG